MSKPEDKLVLVVDDEPDIREYLAAIIEDAGFMVDTAADGVECLEKVSEKKPDLITLDMVMPRKSGIKTMRELRKNENWAMIPVIVISAHARDELGSKDVREIMAFPARIKPKTILDKPIKPFNMVQVIAEILNVELDVTEADFPEGISRMR